MCAPREDCQLQHVFIMLSHGFQRVIARDKKCLPSPFLHILGRGGLWWVFVDHATDHRSERKVRVMLQRSPISSSSRGLRTGPYFPGDKNKSTLAVRRITAVHPQSRFIPWLSVFLISPSPVAFILLLQNVVLLHRLCVGFPKSPHRFTPYKGPHFTVILGWDNPSWSPL